MTHALIDVSASYDPGMHPHAPAGSPQGGEFSPTGGGKAPAKKPASRRSTSRPARPAGHHSGPTRHVPAGQLGFDGAHGTGYGMKGGDPRIKQLQAAANRLGLVDGHGRKLTEDGKLGPKTTQVIEAAQRRLGMKPTGIIDPAFITRLAAMKSLPGAHGKTPAKSAVKKSAPKKAAAAGAAPGNLLGVELARPGPWKLSTGQTEFTEQMLRDAADFFTASGGQAVPVRLGHTDSRFGGDGEPAFGSVTNIRYVQDDRGPVLLGDVVDMPTWLAAAAPKRWPNRSVEGWQDFEYDGRQYSLVLDGLAFLGVTPPAVRNIRSLADLQVALAASSAVRIAASAPDVDLAASPSTPASEAEDEPTEEGTGMDPVKIREALGLSADASDEEVQSTFNVGFTNESPPPEAEPVQAALFEPQASKETRKEPVLAAGTMRVDASAWQAAQERIKRLEAKEAQRLVAERDQVITQAVHDGKFAPTRREHWVRLWDADPDGAREAIGGLAPNVIPVMASGYADGGEGPDEFEAEFAHLFGAATGKGGRR